jgi:hypothetical protein
MRNILRMDISREEKVRLVIEALLASNSLREPSAYWRIGYEFEKIVYRYLGNGSPIQSTPKIRIEIPKRPTLPNVRYIFGGNGEKPGHVEKSVTGRGNVRYAIEDL